MNDIQDTAAIKLAAAIIRQAVADLDYVHKPSKDKKNKDWRKDAVHFFESRYFRELGEIMGLEPEHILDKVQDKLDGGN